MGFRASAPFEIRETQGPLVMSKELLAALRQRVESKYYDQPQVIEIIARAILMSRGIYPQ